MKEYEGKECSIHIRRDNKGQDLFFNGIISSIDADQKLITFRDRYEVLYTFRFADIVQINEKRK